MRNSLIILIVFLLAAFAGRIGILPDLLLSEDLSAPTLFCFMFLAGISIGCNRQWLNIFTRSGLRLLLLPCASILGTFLGAACVGLFLPVGFWDCMAVAGGFGYYSLSSIFITQYKGPDLGAMALVANVLRELIALVFMPLIVAKCGKWAAVSVGGATSMDTTLPMITLYAGPSWAVPALIHGISLDITVPFWVSLFCSL